MRLVLDYLFSMDDETHFFIPPPMDSQPEMPAHPSRVTLTRPGGETYELDPLALVLTSEQPQVDRMSGDWGAICEVFRRSASHYVAVAGFSLQPGDRLTLYSEGQAPPLTLVVMELEGRRARVSAA